MKTPIRSVLPLLIFLYLAPVTSTLQAVVPPPDGGYPGFNTAEGTNALLSLTTGVANTAVGWSSLKSNTDGSFNTAVGAGTLLFNFGNQTLGDGVNNTAIGAAALLFNTTGHDNTAVGVAALLSNDDGASNTALGSFALQSNTDGNFNTAVGDSALFDNIDGLGNTACGADALRDNATGNGNTAIGQMALPNNISGSNNTALGLFAGLQQTTGSNNVYIGADIQGAAGESNRCYIASIFGQTSASGVPVLINSSNRLGTTTSSKRFKEEIKPMNGASETLLALKPVTFRYKKAVDPVGTSQFGLVAEDVEKVNPDLVVRDKEGKPYSVRYDQVNAMLLNEFLKEHAKVEKQDCKIREQEATITRLTKQIETVVAHSKEQDAQIQRVSAQIELNRSGTKLADDNQ
jgi:Chaperone of endosialidase